MGPFTFPDLWGRKSLARPVVGAVSGGGTAQPDNEAAPIGVAGARRVPGGLPDRPSWCAQLDGRGVPIAPAAFEGSGRRGSLLPRLRDQDRPRTHCPKLAK